MGDYLDLPGHKIAFRNPPTHLFVVCAENGWTVEEYLAMKKERGAGRFIDDYESHVNYQILVNERCRAGWLEDLYEKGCGMSGSKMPLISRFSIYDSKEEIKQKMYARLKEIFD